ncbi:MAG: hypothetical protein B7Y39_04195 [Bdellovibrio sp. 28-41-41]|nr:MAG: hypothetical protein B7Y39_04195 [Bdellovibrio sp. 28-41-41]
MRTNTFSQTPLLNTGRDVRQIFIVLVMIFGFSTSASSIEGARIGAPVERPKIEKYEDDWRILLGAPALLTLGLFVLGGRKLKRSQMAGRKEKKTKKKRGRWKNVPY